MAKTDMIQKQIYTPFRRWGQLALATILASPPLAVPVVILAIWPHAHVLALAASLATLPYLALFVFACYTVLPQTMVRILRPKLVRKVEAVYGRTHSVDAPMVGFSPGSEMRLYNGDTCSDFGLLFLEPGRLTYCGDTTTFQLKPEQVESVVAVQQSFLTQPCPRLLIVWRAEAGQPPQAFTLEAWDAYHLWQSRALAQGLLRRLEAWRHADAAPATGAAPAPPADLPGQP